MRKLAGLFLAVAITGHASAEDLATNAQAAISHYRAEHGLPPVRADARLMRLAAEQARAMARAGVLEHDVDKPFAARVVRYDPAIAVENIACGTRDFAATLELWKHSPGHDTNLRRAGVTHFGIASAPAPDSKYRIFWALIMASSESPHRLRQAAAPALLRAAPDSEPVMRVDTERPQDSQPGLLSKLKGVLQPLWGSGSSAARSSGK